MIRITCLCTLAILMLGAVWAKPLDGTANLTLLAQMSRMSRATPLPQATLTATRMQATSDNADVALVALLLLAYTDDAESTKVLQRITADAQHPLLAGAAAYAQYARETQTLSDDGAQSALIFALGRASNPYTRLFLATRLYVGFGETVMTALLADAREEQDPLVQAYLLQYLSKSDDATLLQAVAVFSWPTKVTIPENLISVMHALYPVDNPLSPVDPCANLLQQVKGKLNPKYTKYLRDSWTEAWWGRENTRQHRGIETIVASVELSRVEDAAQRINWRYITDTMQLCRSLTNTVTGRQFNEQRHVLGSRLLRGLLRQAEPMNLTDEVAVVECLTQFGPGHQQALTDEEWAAQRKENTPLLLHTWQRIFTTIDPNYDMNQRLFMQADLPAGVTGPTGIAPECIDDPQLRAQYEENIKLHKQRIEKFNEQLDARKLQQTFTPICENYLIALYAHLPDDREAFATLLDNYSIDGRTKTRLLQAVAEKLDLRAK